MIIIVGKLKLIIIPMTVGVTNSCLWPPHPSSSQHTLGWTPVSLHLSSLICL